jgi:signal transduction histidine kinase
VIVRYVSSGASDPGGSGAVRAGALPLRPRYLALLSAIAVALLWVGTELGVQHTQHVAVDDALQDIHVVAAAAETTLERTLAISDNAARVAQGWRYRRDAGLPVTALDDRLITLTQQPMYGVTAVWITDRYGKVEESTDPTVLGRDLSRDAGYLNLVEQPDGIAFRHVIRHDGHPILVAYYGLRNAHGAFAGVAAICIDPWVISRHVMERPDRPTITAALYDQRTGQRLAALPEDNVVTPPLGGPLEPRLQPDPEEGPWSDGFGTQGKWLIAWAPIRHGPLVAVVTLPTGDAIAGVAGTVRFMRLAALAMTLCIGFVLWLTLVHARKVAAQAERDRAIAVYDELLQLLRGAPVVLLRLAVTQDGTLRNLLTAGDTMGVLGWPAGTLQSAPDVAAAMGAARLAREIARLRQNGTTDVELPFHRKDGSSGWARLAGRVIGARPNGALELLMVLADCTREAGLRAEAEVAARFALLAEFAGSVGHELTQPLFAARLATEYSARLLEEDTPRNDAARTQIAAAATELQRALETLHRLREVSRADAPPADCVASLQAALDEAIAIIQPLLARARITLLTDLRPLPDIVGSRIGVVQVLVNLLRNAAEAVTAHGSGPRWIRVSAQIDEWTELSIADSGGGVPETALPDIFGPFFTTKEAGTGLGLAVCLRNVAAIGGEITVHNAEDGAVFTVRFRPAEPLTTAEVRSGGAAPWTPR